jgi:pimeloyl-ACP methyl ester carboxylesterase
MMIRTYGQAPYRTAVIHGGPGAPGSAAGLARGLADRIGVLEPLQSARSIAAAVAELDGQLPAGEGPFVLIGHSWGAWLAGLYAAGHPDRVKKLILVGCGPLEAKYVPAIEHRRLARFSGPETRRYREILAALASDRADGGEKDRLIAELGELCEKSDGFQPLPDAAEAAGQPPFDGDMYAKLFGEAAELRRTGKLLDAFAAVACPVCVIHGEADPHPAAGIVEPLRARGVAFAGFMLPHCGHTPWREAAARDEFFAILRREIGC